MLSLGSLTLNHIPCIMKQTYSNIHPYLLGILLLFLALNAFFGGYYGMAGAEGVPREWLTGTPFQNYFIPGLILAVVVGGASLSAGLLVLLRHAYARSAALAAAAIILGWIVVQVAIIGYVSWMQPSVFVMGLVILLLAWCRPAPGKVSN